MRYCTTGHVEPVNGINKDVCGAKLQPMTVLAYRMVGNFCGVQIFVDFMCSAYPQKLLNFSYITK